MREIPTYQKNNGSYNFVDPGFYPEGVNAPYNTRTEREMNRPTPKTKPNYNKEYKIHIQGNTKQNQVFNLYVRDSLKWYAKGGAGPAQPRYFVFDEVVDKVRGRVEPREYSLGNPLLQRVEIKGKLNIGTNNFLKGKGNTLRQIQNFNVTTYVGINTNTATQNPTRVTLKNDNFTVMIFSNKTVLVNAQNENILNQVQQLLTQLFGVGFTVEETRNVYRICASKKIDIPTLKDCILPPTTSVVHKRFVEEYGSQMIHLFKQMLYKESQTKVGEFHFKFRKIGFSVYTSGKIVCSINTNDTQVQQIASTWKRLVTFCEKAGYHIMSSEKANPAECAGETRTQVKTAQKGGQRNAQLTAYTMGTPIGNKQYVVPALNPTGYAVKNVNNKQKPRRNLILKRFSELAPQHLTNINKMINNFRLGRAGITKQHVEEYLKTTGSGQAPAANKKKSTNPKLFKGSPPNFNSNRWLIKNNKGEIVKILRPSEKGDELKEYEPTIKPAKLVELFTKWGKTPGGAVPKVLANKYKVAQARPEAAIQTALKEKANRNAAKAAANKAKRNEEERKKQAASVRKHRLETTTRQQRRQETKAKSVTQKLEKAASKLAEMAKSAVAVVRKESNANRLKRLRNEKIKSNPVLRKQYEEKQSQLAALKAAMAASIAAKKAANKAVTPPPQRQVVRGVSGVGMIREASVKALKQRFPGVAKAFARMAKPRRPNYAFGTGKKIVTKRSENNIVREQMNIAKKKEKQIQNQVATGVLTNRQGQQRITNAYETAEKLTGRKIKELVRKQRDEEAKTKKQERENAEKRQAQERINHARKMELNRIMTLPENQRNKAMTAFFNTLARKLPTTQYPNVLGNLYKSMMESPNSNSNSNSIRPKKKPRTSPK
jgi:hypothetical protein